MKFHLPIPIITLLTATALHAEITLDGTLGPKIALEGPNYDISANLGQQRGSNLFHSFGQFNLVNEEIATFSGPENISNIIGRVTGGSPSSIDGTLSSTIDGAALYLINPAGMMFGSNASLDIPGSFHASTADTLRFSDGSEFNARNPQESLLTIAPISAFGFLTDSPAPLSIENSQKNITTPEGVTFSLIGGNIRIDNGLFTVPLGRINIASVASRGYVTPLPDDLTLSAKPGDISLRNVIMTTAGGSDTGGIFIRAGHFFLDGTTVSSTTKGITNGANINVQAETLTVTQGGGFTSNTLSNSSGGQINIKVAGLTEFSGWTTRSNGKVNQSGITADSSRGGNAGTIELETGALALKDGASIRATAHGQGQGGHINIRVADSINLSGFGSQGQGSFIAANTRGTMENAGNGGVINLEARQLSLKDGAQIGSITVSTGKGGYINIKAEDSVSLSGKDKRGFPSRMSTTSTSSGNGGKISLEAKRLNLVDGTSIIASTIGTGQGGNIKILMSDLVKFKGLDSGGYGSSITAQANGEMPDAGKAGTIELSAGRLQLSDGALISTSTYGPGQGGQLNVKVTKNAFFSGQDKEGYSSGLFTSSEGQMKNAGKGGILTLVVGDLHLIDKAEINAGTYGPGDGGSVHVRANTIKLTDGGKITALSEALGNAGQVELILTDKLIIRNGFIETKAENADGGDLSITTPSYVYLIDGEITTSVSEEFGEGGNITASPQFIVLDNATMFAKAKKGKGGNINVTTTGIYNFTGEPIEKIINASSEFGVDGVVVIETPDNGAEEGIFALPASLFDATALMNTPCGQRVAENISRFVLVPSEGAANAVADLFASGPLLSQIKEVKQVSNSEGTDHHFMKVALLTGCRPDSNARDNDDDIVHQKSSVVPEHLLF
jgi:filamentous hemagglutinin family protein